MSSSNVQEWLASNNRYHGRYVNNQNRLQNLKKIDRRAYTISVSSGKGGVGKTSVSIKFSKILASQGYKVLLIDCDYNLSNTAIKLGIPVNDNFSLFVNNKIAFDECLHRDNNFHLLSACNGDFELFDNCIKMDQFVVNLLLEHEREYDFIILDCPAGISKETLTINAYCDFRFVVVNPDKSSITDSYSLIKILNNKYGVTDTHLLVNKVSSSEQYKRIIRIMSETVENFLSSRLHILGGIKRENTSVDLLDNILFSENTSLHNNFIKIVRTFTERFIATSTHVLSNVNDTSFSFTDDFEQDVQNTIS